MKYIAVRVDRRGIVFIAFNRTVLSRSARIRLKPDYRTSGQSTLLSDFSDDATGVYAMDGVYTKELYEREARVYRTRME